jgi:hypothetical protein
MNCCNVCTENYNRTNRKIVTCSCNYSACRQCIKNYLEYGVNEPHCMSCKNTWDRSFMTSAFEKSYLTKQYRDYRQKVLYERELLLMPATQVVVKNRIKREKINSEIAEIREAIDHLKRELYIKEKELKTTTDSSGRIFSSKCPNDNCLGFLSNDGDIKLKCGLCDTKVCAKCREELSRSQLDQHACNPHILENIKAMEIDCRNCPKCDIVIYKIDGCEQMFCTPEFGGCGIAFDWKTLKITTRGIHNPHYFDWERLNQNPERNPHEIRCGREIDYNFLRAFNEIMKLIKNPSLISCFDVRTFIHLREVTVRRYEPPEHDNLELRISYMRKFITEKEFKNSLYRIEKTNDKKKEIHVLMGLYISCATDIFYRILENPDRINEIGYYQEILALQDYINQELFKIAKNYNCGALNILENHILINVGKV